MFGFNIFKSFFLKFSEFWILCDACSTAKTYPKTGNPNFKGANNFGAIPKFFLDRRRIPEYGKQ